MSVFTVMGHSYTALSYPFESCLHQTRCSQGINKLLERCVYKGWHTKAPPLQRIWSHHL